MEIKEFNDIDLDIDEGKLLFMAIARLSVSIDYDKTPDEIVGKLAKLDEELRR